VPDAALHSVVADLSRMAEVRRAADAILSRTGQLSVLVNNAGILCGQHRMTDEGREMTLAVNHLAPFLLTRLLEPALAAARGRVVHVGSSTSDRARIDPDNLELTHGWTMVRAYARSKLALLMTALDEARRLEASGVTLNVAHPGMVGTGLVRTRGPREWGWRVIRPFVLTEAQGAATPLAAAVSPALAGVSGAYLKRRGQDPACPVAPNPRALDAALRGRVLAATERLLA